MKKNDELSDYVFGKVQPQALPLEEAVIGACMLDKEAFPIASTTLTPDKFYLDAHRLIFTAMKRLSEKGAPIDLVTVTEELKTMKSLEKVGGPHYLVDLTNRVASGANVEYHSRIVAQKAIQRELITISSNIIKDAYEDTTDVFELLEAVNIRLSSINSFTTSTIRTMEAATKKLMADSKERFDGTAGYSIPLTGLPDIDDLYGSAVPGDVFMCAGDSGSGKSSFGNNIMCYAALVGTPVYSWSGEWPIEAQAASVLTALSHTPYEDIMDGKFWGNGQDLQNVEKAYQHMMREFIHFDTGEMRLANIRSLILRQMRQYGTKIFLFDRIELMSSHGAGSPEQAKAQTMQTLRNIAAQTGAIIVVFAQLGKTRLDAKTNKRPDMHCIVGGGEVYQSATKLLLFYRPEMYRIETFKDGSPTAGRGEIILGKANKIVQKAIKVDFRGAETVWGGGYFIDTVAVPDKPKEVLADKVESVAIAPQKINDEPIPF